MCWVHSVAIGHSDIPPQLARQQEDHHGACTSASRGLVAVVAFRDQITESESPPKSGHTEESIYLA